MPTSDQALTLEDVSVAYGQARVVHGVSFTLRPASTTALIGPNGAGKSTLLRAISSQADKVSGRVIANGIDITRMAAHRIARRGVIHVPEGRHVIAPLTVEENLTVAGRASGRCPAGEISVALDLVYGLFPPLRRLRDSPSGLLSGGEQQMVALGRALMARPSVLLLDEPSMGLAPVMVDVIYGFLADHGGALDGTAVLLAEQNSVALDVADHAVVLSRGQVVFDGSVDDLAPGTLTRAYLGGAPEPQGSGMQRPAGERVLTRETSFIDDESQRLS